MSGLRMRIRNESPFPLRYSTAGAAGLDLHAWWALEAGPGSARCTGGMRDGLIYHSDHADSERGWSLAFDGRATFSTGLYLEIPAGHVGLVRSRSSLFHREGIFTSGTIDEDFRGEMQVTLHGSGIVRRGDRIAQLVIVPIARVEVEEVEALTPTARGAGGWGSTGRGSECSCPRLVVGDRWGLERCDECGKPPRSA